jgi:hypothetical protein
MTWPAESGTFQEFRQALQFARREGGGLYPPPQPLVSVPGQKPAGTQVVGVMHGSGAVLAHSWSVPTDAV